MNKNFQRVRLVLMTLLLRHCVKMRCYFIVMSMTNSDCSRLQNSSYIVPVTVTTKVGHAIAGKINKTFPITTVHKFSGSSFYETNFLYPPFFIRYFAI